MWPFGIALVCLLVWSTIRRFALRQHTPSPKPPSSQWKKGPDRQPGTWTPSTYTRPTPESYPDWSLQDTEPLPYRPHKWGPNYPITMGLRAMPMDEWIELDNRYPYFHHERTTRMREMGTAVSRTAPEGLAGAHELLDELREYLPQRYPSLFRKTAEGIENLHTGDAFNTIDRPLKQDPMQIVGSLVQEDVCILVERADGQYYLAGGAVCSRGVWCLEERLGMPLSQIHVEYGKVPHFREKLEKGVMNLFRRIQPENPVQRNTWYVIGEDAINREGFTVGAGEKGMPEDNFFYKTERQTVRRLPLSGAVVFTFRTYTVPITDMVHEPYAPGRLASAIRSWDPEMAKYKGRETFDKLLDFLDEKHSEQMDNGLDMSKEDEVHKYPY
ncbi:MAG: hypothetical protein Q9202_006298 [Teloschistes flavicans]